MESSNEDLKEILHKEIDLIQGCISRMSQHSFYLKGWLITLIGVTLTITSKSNNIIFINVLLIFTTSIFWYLNAYYLRMERMYRKLYDWTITERLKGNKELLYNLDPARYNNKVDSILKTMFAKTLRAFYGITFFILIAFLCYNITPIVHEILCPYK